MRQKIAQIGNSCTYQFIRYDGQYSTSRHLWLAVDHLIRQTHTHIKWYTTRTITSTMDTLTSNHSTTMTIITEINLIHQKV